MIYLDHAAHTQADKLVLKEFLRAEEGFYANPLSKHGAGREAMRELKRVTEETAKIFGASPDEIVFTSGASESNNMAVKGLARAYRHIGKHIITTAMEHPSVTGPMAQLAESGYEIELADIKPNGEIDIAHLEELIRNDTVLISVSLVDSEIGAIQPIKKISEIIKKHKNCRLHVDAVQAVGKIDVNFSGIDTLSFSAHKIGGICGSGGLLVKRGTMLEPILHGGLSQNEYRAGTPALSHAAAMLKALELAKDRQIEFYDRLCKYWDMAAEALENIPGVKINSPKQGCKHILNLSAEGIKAKDMQEALSEKGVYVSVKSACSSPGTPSRAVLAVSKNKQRAVSSFRISFGYSTKESDITGFIKAFTECLKEFRSENTGKHTAKSGEVHP